MENEKDLEMIENENYIINPNTYEINNDCFKEKEVSSNKNNQSSKIIEQRINDDISNYNINYNFKSKYSKY